MINNHLSLVPELKVDRERYDNRTASYNGHFSLARAAGLRKYGYGNGFTVMDPISGTTLLTIKYIGNCKSIFEKY